MRAAFIASSDEQKIKANREYQNERDAHRGKLCPVKSLKMAMLAARAALGTELELETGVGTVRQ